jgi:hypothetical protein
MALQLDAFPESVRSVLEKYSGQALPLTRSGECNHDEAARIQASSPSAVLPGARAPEGALSGLLLLAGCWEDSHKVSQDIESQEGSYWHAIAHRIEPDSSNARWWFGQVGEHPIFPELHRRASEILERYRTPWTLNRAWEPSLFIEWCDEARRTPGSEPERAALEIQRAEWELLFAWCALPPARNA